MSKTPSWGSIFGIMWAWHCWCVHLAQSHPDIITGNRVSAEGNGPLLFCFFPLLVAATSFPHKSSAPSGKMQTSQLEDIKASSVFMAHVMSRLVNVSIREDTGQDHWITSGSVCARVCTHHSVLLLVPKAALRSSPVMQPQSHQNQKRPCVYPTATVTIYKRERWCEVAV